MKHEILCELQGLLRGDPGFRESLEELADRGEEPTRTFANGLLIMAEKYEL